MVRVTWVYGLLVFSLCLLPVAAQAQQEHGGQEHAGTTTADPAVTQEEPGGHVQEGTGTAAPAAAPEATTPVATMAPEAPLPPALKPITITFSGELTAVDLQASPAMVTVQDRYGVKKEVAVPTEAKVSQGEAAKALGDLKVGDKLTIEYTYDVATGKRTAQSIAIGEGTAAVR